MPFLRFTRDKRGYETTSLVHAVRRKGRSRQKILYWFRTPPGVKVGRPALDADAIRWIEEHNPDIEFNWQKILEAQSPAAPPPSQDGKTRRTKRVKSARPQQSERESSQAQQLVVEPKPPAMPIESDLSLPDELEGAEVDLAGEPLVVDDLAEALEQLTHPDAEEKIAPAATAVDHVIGPEQLVRLRARYAELLARITERGGDPERIEALRSRAESLDPDTWVTEEEARKGTEMFEPTMADLRAALGLRRRRRSRRGGRRRKGGSRKAAPETHEK